MRWRRRLLRRQRKSGFSPKQTELRDPGKLARALDIGMLARSIAASIARRAGRTFVAGSMSQVRRLHAQGCRVMIDGKVIGTFDSISYRK